MDIMIGKVTGSKVDYSLNSTNANKVTLLQIATSESKQDKGSAPAAAHDMQLLSSSGEDTTPQPGARVAFMRSGGFNLVVATDDMITPTTSAGEKELYSIGSTGKTKYARFKLKNNGKMMLKNESASMDLFTALNNAMQALETFSGAAAQAAVSAGGSSAASLAAAIVALMVTLNASLSTAATQIGQVLDNAP